jgi:RNA exonuclease 4
MALTAEEKQYVGLDCEMVGIDPRSTSVLAEVVLVNWNGDVIYHSYVAPPAPVTNYRTQYSGIVAGVLESEGRPFRQVQAEVARLIRGKIVVGHGLINDFKALQLAHPPDMIRDTTLHPAFMKPNPRTGTLNPQKLSKLALEYLGITIQQGTHDPAEDARTAMALFRMFKDLWGPAPKMSFASVVAARGGTRKNSAARRRGSTRSRRHIKKA